MVCFNRIIHMEGYKEVRIRKAQNLRRIREMFSLKQWEVGEIIKCKESIISDMERAKRAISDRTIELLCRKLKIDPEEFYFRPDTPSINDPAELEVVSIMRKYPEIKEQITVISEALAEQYKGESGAEEDHREGHSFQAGKKKKRKRQAA